MTVTPTDPAALTASEEPRYAGPPRRPGREPAARTRARSLPVVPVRARGMTVEDAAGRRYLDCLSGGGSLLLGHNHPVVLEAVRAALRPGRGAGSVAAVRSRFVAELVRSLPPALADGARIRICGPTERDALTAAVRLVRQGTGRSGLAVCGVRPDAADGRTEPDGDDASPTVRLPYPSDHRCPFGIGGRVGHELCLRRAGELLGRPGDGRAPAAVLVEPVLGETGGVEPAPDAWLRSLRELTRQRNVPLIVDESQTGVGRTGAPWGIDHSGIVPDVLLLARTIGGGLPLSVLVHREDPGAERPDACREPLQGNQPAMAAGAATLAYVRGNALAARAAVLGRRMLRHLRDLASGHACVGDVRGRGLMLGVELVDPAGSDRTGGEASWRTRPATPAPELAAAVQRACLHRGLIVGVGGPDANVVLLLPPLVVTDEQADSVLDRLSDALDAVTRAAT